MHAAPETRFSTFSRKGRHKKRKRELIEIKQRLLPAALPE
jgi:hypothetical protein